MPVTKSITRVATLFALVGLAACSDSGTSPNNSQLSTAVAADIGFSTMEEADLTVGSMAVGTSEAFMSDPGFIFFTPGLTPGMGQGGGNGHPKGPPPFGPPGTGCKTVSPNPPEDPDLDNVPTLLVITFDGTKCKSKGPMGNLARSGTITLSDPFPTTPGFDLDEQIVDLTTRTSLAKPASGVNAGITVTRNGTRTVRGVGNVITATEEFSILEERGNSPPTEITRDWQAVFTGVTAPVVLQPLPSGTVDISGSMTWTRKNQSHLVEVTTPVLLAYDATCTDDRPFLRFTSGEIDAVVTVNGVVEGTVQIVFTGCGIPPTKTFTPAS